jgi:glycosyltransferase involved in cell wall biosynthesis
VLEATACGVPVVATEVGGVPEIVANGETGFLFPAGDEQAGARRVARLLDDPALHARMAQASRRAAVDRFAWQPHVDALLRLWRDLGAPDARRAHSLRSVHTFERRGAAE